MAFAYALASLFFAGFNDVLFKLYSREKRPRGLYLGLIGIFWTLFFLTLGHFTAGLQFSPAVVKWGLISGSFSALANILLIESMTTIEAGICSTVYRLNLVPASLLAILLLGESFSTSTVLGLCLAVAAVLLFFSGKARPSAISRFGVVLIVLASLSRAGMGLTYKQGLNVGAEMNSLLAINGICWAIGGFAYYWLLERKVRGFKRRVVAGYAFASGLMVCGIVFFLAMALRNAPASLVLPVAQLSFVVTGTLGILFLKEKCTPMKCAGFACAVGCIFCMC